MKFTKNSAAILAILFVIVGAEYYYMSHQADDITQSNSTDDTKITTPKPKEATKGLITDEDRAIMATIQSYQGGYKEGCAQSKMPPAGLVANQPSDQSRAYTLGLQRGKAECGAKIAQDREDYDLGYRDGCSSVVKELIQDSALYNSSAEYKKGWDRGSIICRDRG